MTSEGQRPSMWLAHDGLAVGWRGPLGPSIAWLETWAREEPILARTLGNPGADLPVAAIPWIAGDGLVAFWCEEAGAFSARFERSGHASPPVLLVPDARAIALAGGPADATLFCADGRGIVRIDVDAAGAPLGALRRCLSERRAGTLLAAARLRDEALLLFAHRGSSSVGVVAARGERDVVVRHPLRAACEDIAVAASGGRAAVALELAGGKVALAILGAEGKVIERPHPVLERGPGPLGSPRVVWSEDDWTLLAHDRERHRLLVHPVGDKGEEFALPRCAGPFAAAYWAQHIFALEITPDEEGAELRLWRCARDGSAPQQRVFSIGLADARVRRTELAMRRLLVALSDRLGGAQGYRQLEARPALGADGASLSFVDAQGRLSLRLETSERGVRLRVTSALGADEGMPEPPSSLVRLARWVKERFSPTDRAAGDAERAWASRLAEELGATVLRCDRAGAALVLELALLAPPSADGLDPWLRRLRKQQLERLSPS